MIAGPVFHFELVRTARRPRFYITRFAFGLVLLGILGLNYASLASTRWIMDGTRGGSLTTREMNAFGYAVFASLMVAQAALVLGLTPALVADSVASERQRKTLHYLMTSRLKGVEIVLGKLSARLLNLGTYLAAALPIVSLLTLFGGIDPAMLVLAYAAIGSTAFFLAALAILASVTSRRSRDAVGAAYGLGATWLFGPPIIQGIVPALIGMISDLYRDDLGGRAGFGAGAFALIVLGILGMGAMTILAMALLKGTRDAVGLTYALISLWLVGPPLAAALAPMLPPPLVASAGWAGPFAEWALPGSPLGLLSNSGPMYQGGFDAVWREVAWMIGSQLAFGALLVAIAAWQVRPAFRRLESRSERPSGARRASRRWPARRPCGDDPIYWKEAYFLRSGGGLARRIARMSVPFLLLSIASGIVYFCAGDAFRELRAYGYGAGEYRTYVGRSTLNMALRVAGTGIFAFGMLQLAGLTAASFTSEREQDTWISLLSTPLEGREILRGKMFGALRAMLPFGVTLLGLWLFGLAAGAVHPLGFLAALAAAGMFTWFVTALGTFASLKLKTTWRSQVLTQGVIIAPHLCCVFYAPSILAIMGLSLLSYSNVKDLLEIEFRWWRNDASIWPALLMGAYLTIYVVVGLLFYLGGAIFMTWAAFSGFEATADRPRNPRRGPRPAADAKKAFFVDGPGTGIV